MQLVGKFHSKAIECSLNATFLVLIPKKKGVEDRTLG